MLCEACQAIFGNKEPSFGELIPHHKTLASSQSALASGCRICSTLRKATLANHRSTFSSPYILHPSDYYSTETKSLTLTVKIGSTDEYFDLVPTSSSADAGLSGEHEYKVGSGRPAWDLIENWIDNCAQNHVKCNQTSQKERWYPTRLLDLRNATELRVKLIDTTETPPDGPYVSLSHRWHSTSVKKTTQDTLTAFMNGFDVSSLPKTFQDAITVSRNLNVRFLWIDSLCIIQETNDWERESSLMGHIYANAMCNLSALGATAENGGLFFPRDAESIRPLKLEIACKDGPYDLVHQGFWKSAVDDMDLNLRGWVFQERLLAPRALHFGSEQLFWECRELNACESYPEGLREEIWTRPWKRDYTDTGLSHMPSRKLMMIWHELIEQYTRCSLTMGEDKLVAISGIAKIVQQKLEDDYLAGLWRRNLLEDLCGT